MANSRRLRANSQLIFEERTDEAGFADTTRRNGLSCQHGDIMNPPTQAVGETLLERYERLALAWDDAQSNAKRANKLFVEIHRIAVILRQSDEGRAGIETLLRHSNRGVRVKSAGDALEWDSTEAVRALDNLASSSGSHSFTASVTLREYRAGRLRFDW